MLWLSWDLQPMSYTVKLAIFPPWKAPVPYKTLGETFATMAEASSAGEKVLAPITERELAELAPRIRPRSERVGERWVTAIAVPEEEVHGFVIYDEAGVEAFNWTTLDAAMAGAATVQVSLGRLREIGWSVWNPIGLAGPPATPADEYDAYLTHVTDMLLAGAGVEAGASYLTRVAEEQMGVVANPEAARATSAAIRACLDER